MLSTENYDRVKELLQLSVKPEGSQDTEERTISSDVHTAVDEAKGTSEEFQRDKSVGQSQTKEGADGWMASFGVESKRHLETIKSSKAHHETLRIKMADLVQQGASLSPTLIEPLLEQLRHSSELVTIPVDMRGMFGGAVEATGRAYISALEKVKNEEREQAAKAILDQLNSVGNEHASNIQTSIPDPHEQPVPVPDDDDKPGPVPPVPPKPRRPVNPDPRPGGGGVGNVVTGGVSGLTGGGSGVSGWVRPSGDELGSISNPITDPDDLSHIDLARTPINARMTPNGPVGGHMPADVLNIDDPAWRAVPPSSGGAARIVGGTLVAGSAAGAAGGFLGRGGGYGGIAGMTPGAALRPSAPAGGVLRSPSLSGGGAGIAGRGGVGAAGRGGVGVAGRGGVGAAGRGGVVGTGGQSGARSAGVAGRGGAGVAGRGGVGAAGRGGAGAAGRGGAGTAGRGGAGTAGRGGAGTAGRGGAGTAGRGGVSGVVGREAGAGSGRGGAAGRGGAGAGGRGGAGVAGRGGAGGRGVLGGGSSAGRGEKKKETQRRNYDVVRIDGIEEQSTGLVGGAAGSADQLKPLSRDSGEDW